jgi:hypothetical protein
MKNFFRMIFAFIFFSIAFPGISQVKKFSSPKEDGLFVIGWSKQGTKIAFGWFEKTKMISNGSQIMVIVQDIITDDFLLQEGKTWDEGNAGPGGSNYYPDSVSQAWKKLPEDIHYKLIQFDIQDGVSAGVFFFPMKSDGKITIRVEELNNGNDYEVIAISEKLGQKIISKGKKNPGEEITEQGFVRSPDLSRIAVVLKLRSYSYPYPKYLIAGCHLGTGFKK